MNIGKNIKKLLTAPIDIYLSKNFIAIIKN